MPFSSEESHAHATSNAMTSSPRFPRRKKPHQRPLTSALFWPAMLPLIIVSSLLVNWLFLAQDVYAAPLAPTAQSGNLTFQQYASEGQQSKAPHGAFVRPAPAKPKKIPHPQADTLPSVEPATMKPITQVLSSAQTDATMLGASGLKPLDFTSSDGRFEVQVPSGAFDLTSAQTSQGATPSGVLTLSISQVHGHSVGLENLLGAYQIQVLDSQNKPLKKLALRTPITIIYHYQTWEMQALDLNPDQIYLSWPGLLASDKQAKVSTASDVVRFTNDTKTKTLTAQTTVVDMSANLSVGSEPNNQSAPTPRFASVQGNSGNLSYSYPLQIAPGTAGFEPTLQLAYSSGAANARHSQVSPADDAGDGWSISLGSITASQQLTPDGTGTETVYALSGVDNVSDRLIPDPNNAGFFLTEHLSHLRIQQGTNGTTGQPCFTVYDTSGTYSQYGCTTDSLQYYTTAAGRTNYAWDLNVEGSPFQGPNTASESMWVHYLQDTATVGGYTSVRDSALEQVQYGKISSAGTFTASGTVDFHYHAPTASTGKDGLNQAWATAYPSNYNCSATPPASTTLRCDDPLANGSSAAPATMSTLTLDSIATFVGDDSATTHLDYAYALAYNQDAPFASCNDPETGVALYCAGEHTLASITPSAYLGGTAHAQKSTVFTYTAPVTNSYVDSSETNLAGQTFSGQSTWKYLASYDDLQTGVGEHITYGTAWNNTHGTPAQSNGDDRYEPLYCSLYGGCTGAFANPNDHAWTVQVVTQIKNWGTDSSSSKLAPAITTYDYSLTDVGGSCPSDGNDSDCVGYEWYPSGDTNWINYYDAEFRGFASVYITSPAGDLTVDNYASTEGLDTPSTDAENYLTGTLKNEEVYQGNSSGGPLLQETKNTYAGDDNGGSVSSCDGKVGGTEYPACEDVLLYHTVHTYNGTSTDLWAEQDFYYDDYDLTNGLSVGKGYYHNLTEEDTTYSNAPETRQLWTYAPNDQSAGGFAYYDVNKVTLSRIYDSSNHIWGCTYTSYDEGDASGVPTPAGGWPTRVQTYRSADCAAGLGTTILTRTYTGYDGYGNVVATVDGVGTNNASVYASVGCTPATQPTIMTPYFGETRYTSCANYDGQDTHVTSQANALGQTSSTVYDSTQQDQPTSATDPNNQTATASYSYDSNGNPTLITKQPQETNSYSSQSTEVSNCTSNSTLPCFEMDAHSSSYSNAVSRTYYDNEGRTVETRTPGPTPGDDTVTMNVYNDQLHTTWTSIPFQVADGASWLDPNTATDINGHVPAGTATFADALGRTIAVQDPNFGSTQEPGLSCSWTMSGKYTSCVNYSVASPIGDSASYDWATTIDANNHVSESFTDALGQVRYVQVKTGQAGGTVTTVKQTATQYNALGKPTSITVTDEQPQSGQSVTSVTTSMTYDDLGRMLTTTDPDQGTFTASYDADGRVTSVTQTSGSSSRTTGTNYDLLGRVGCVQTAAPTFNTTGACTAGSPLVVNTYDTTKLGTQGTTDFPVGRLTQSVATTYYPDSTSATVTQQVQTDQRGRATNTKMQLALPSSWNVTAGLPSYQLAASYNDANQVTTTSATAGSAVYSFTPVYDTTNGSLQGLSSGSIGSPANLATLAYNEYAQLSGITLLNGSSTQVASEQYSYDGDQRPTSLTTNWLPGSGKSGEILGSTRTYDNASNVTSLNTFFAPVPGQSASGGSEAQNFCYDSLNRLVWSGNGGTQPGAGTGTCGTSTLASGLVGGGYTAPDVYTNLGQIWQGPVNGKGATEQYLYCNSAPHQLTGIYPTGTTCANKGSATAVYSAAYDAWGNETSRTYNSVTATLSYDTLNRMTEYNAGSAGQEFYVYDASGNRVLKRSISGGTTKLTAYAFGLQELSYTGNGAYSSQTDYYSIAGHLIGSTNGTTTTYDLTDAEGSVLTSLSASAVLGEQIYGPYGNQRYTQGTMGTDKGYTGQFQDAATGLDYYNARYYDPVMGQFLSADDVQGNVQGMDPYAYVGDNPETAIDPTGQRISCPPDCDTSGGIPTAIHPGSGISVSRGGGGSGSAPVLLIEHMPKGTTLPTHNTSPCSNDMTGPNCDINEEGICAGYANADPTCQQNKIKSACNGDQTCLTCNDDAKCIGQHHALANAQSADSFFSALVNYLNIAAGVLTAISALLAIATIFQPELAGITALVVGLTGALWELDGKAGELARSFGDLVNDGASYFTHANIEAQMNEVVLIGAGLTVGTAGTIGAVGWALIGQVAAKAGKKFLARTTISGVVVDLAGSIFLGAWAETSLAQENSMVLT